MLLVMDFDEAWMSIECEWVGLWVVLSCQVQLFDVEEEEVGG